jgi:hypothetical protein
MDEFSELIEAVQSDLTVGDESSLFPLATIKLAINRSYRKAGGLFRWPETEDAKKTSTQASQDYYDYPQTWRPDSVWRVEVSGVRYGEEPDGSPLAFPDWLIWKEDYPTSTEKRWSTQWRRYFISPTPITNGSSDLVVYGQEVVEKLVNDSDVTIFSYSMPECNDAITMEAVAILKSKGNNREGGEMISVEAKQILATAWSKIRQEQAKNEKTQPFFEVNDFFSTKSSTIDNIGRF